MEGRFWQRWWPALALAGLIPLVAYMVILLGQIRGLQRDAMEQTLMRTSLRGADAVERFVAGQFSLLGGLSLATSLDAADPAPFQRFAGRILEQRPEWYTLILSGLHANGRPEVCQLTNRLMQDRCTQPRRLRRPLIGDRFLFEDDIFVHTRLLGHRAFGK